jgi:hypothetical protein
MTAWNSDMKKLYLSALAAATLLITTSCSKEEAPATTAAESASVNQLLAYVPEDSPYLMGNLEPIPEAVLDRYLDRMQPMLDEAQRQLSASREALETGRDDGAEAGSEDPAMSLHLALLRELDGKLNRPGLESLGLDLRAHQVLYGMGAFPVVRIGLSDASLFRATVERVLAEAGITAPELDYEGRGYWRLGADWEPDSSAAAYVAVLDDHLAIGLLPVRNEERMLPAFLGLEMPAASDARERLAELNAANDYAPYGSGIIDLHRLADEFLRPDSTLAAMLVDDEGEQYAPFSAECAAEIHGIIDNTPRMTIGVTELTADAVAYQYRLETPESLAGQLMELVPAMPAAGAASRRMLEFAFGMRFGPVRDFLREKALAITAEPYRCEHLQELNQQAEAALERLEQPMPPFLNNFRGVRIAVDDLALGGNSMPESARGHLAVHVEQPQMFVGMAQMFLPDLSELEMMPGDPPLRLPDSMLPMPGVVAYAAMTSDSIGLSLGDGEEAGLPAYLDMKPGPEGTFLSASYDMSAYLEYTGRMSASLQNPEAGANPESSAEAAATSIAAAGQEALQSMMDRNQTTMRFDRRGLVIDGRVTFKEP